MRSKYPNFFICGATKSGTTSLYNYLKQHPQILMPIKKELHFFDYDKKYSKGIKWYKKFFKNIKNEKKIGEATPNYMNFEKVPERIFNFNEDMKLIFIMRNPVNRAYSHYNYSKLVGKEKLSFEEALRKEKKRLGGGDYEHNHNYFSYKQKGRYSEHIKNYLKFFKKKQMLFLIFEIMKKNPQKTLEKTFSFLGVDPDFNPKIKKHHKGGRSKIPFIYSLLHEIHKRLSYSNLGLIKVLEKYKIIKIFKKIMLKKYPKMKKETIKELEEYFKKYNKELEKIIGEKIPEWK